MHIKLRGGVIRHITDNCTGYIWGGEVIQQSHDSHMAAITDDALTVRLESIMLSIIWE